MADGTHRVRDWQRAGWQVLESIEDDTGTTCVDIFRRPDASFGIETFRRDPEDQGRWTVTGSVAAVRYATLDDARHAAARLARR